MAVEPFLVNPYRVRRRRLVLGDKPRGLPSRLLSRMMRTYGPKRGMKEAWRLYRKGITRNEPESFDDNPWYGDPIGHRRAALKGWRTRRTRFGRRGHRRAALKGWRTRRTRLNPFGEEVIIVGSNPRRRRKRARRRIFLDNALRRRIRRRRRFAYSPRRRMARARRRYFLDNPRRRGAVALPAVSLSKPTSLIMPAVVGTAGFFVADRVPSMVNVTGLIPRLGVKAAVTIGGGLLISRFLGRTNGAVWAIGSSINLLNDILKTYIFKTSAVAGLGAYPGQYKLEGHGDLGAYPSEYSFSEYPM